MTRNHVIETIGEDRIDAFDWFMQGQAVGIGEDGKADYDADDVARFLEGLPIID